MFSVRYWSVYNFEKWFGSERECYAEYAEGAGWIRGLLRRDASQDVTSSIYVNSANDSFKINNIMTA